MDVEGASEEEEEECLRLVLMTASAADGGREGGRQGGREAAEVAVRCGLCGIKEKEDGS